MSKQEFAPLVGIDFEGLVRREARQCPWTETELQRVGYVFEIWAACVRRKFHDALLAIEHPEEADVDAKALGLSRSCLSGKAVREPQRPGAPARTHALGAPDTEGLRTG